MPTNADRISIRQQQIQQLRDLIAWEKAHDWGEAGELGRMSNLLIGHYVRAIATLESIEVYLGWKSKRLHRKHLTKKKPAKWMAHGQGTSPGEVAVPSVRARQQHQGCQVAIEGWPRQSAIRHNTELMHNQKEAAMRARECMRKLVTSLERDCETVFAAYAEAEVDGEVLRRSNALNKSPEEYALALWRDGGKKGWL